MSIMEETTLVVDVQETICFFDEVPDYSYKQATSIVSVVGEDLAVGCFQKHLEDEGATVCVRYMGEGTYVYPESVTTGHLRGPRLDRWIIVDCPDGGRTVFQTEIKNSSAHAFSGVKVPLDISVEDLRAYKQKEWSGAWDPESQSLRDPGAAKVLVPMRVPDCLSGSHVKPLLIYWTPIAPESEPDSYLFKVATGHTCPFSELCVFSVSSYLRSLREAKIALRMPVAATRLRILNHLFRQPL